MNKITINVPIEVGFLSQWQNFDAQLPQGKVILNKDICGCGCTEYYLRNDMPVILVSPRKELLNCKMNSDRERPPFYFDRSNARRIKAEVSIKMLKDYVCNPFAPTDFVPKILVTYDSLKLVIDTLINMGVMDKFSIIVDEFTCIFTDVMLKGFLELNLIQMINELPNHVVFISATPISEEHLEKIDVFKDMPYITLKWDPSRYDKVTFLWQKMISTRSAIKDIIVRYRQTGFFMQKMIDGNTVYSNEAVFFLNSVKDIVAVVEDCGLTPDDTLVICADDPKNRTALNKVGFSIGHVPNEQEYKRKNKTYTFVTKASFEGTDFYSDCSSTYIFANPNMDNLALDISIDLRQIAGRCRTEDNPFRCEINYYFKTLNTEKIDVAEAKSRIAEKMEKTEKILSIYSNIDDPDALRKISTAQIVDKYKDDYADVVMLNDGTARVVCNKLAWVADLRAAEIKSEQYKTSYSVLARLSNSGFSSTNAYSARKDAISVFYNEFMKDKNFPRRMKLYIDTIEATPQLKSHIEAMAAIPQNYKEYYNILGGERIKALSYTEAKIKQDIRCLNSIDTIREAVKQYVKSGEKYSNDDVKSMLGFVYSNMGLKITPKATNISALIPVRKVKFVDKNGTRQNGYEIL